MDYNQVRQNIHDYYLGVKIFAGVLVVIGCALALAGIVKGTTSGIVLGPPLIFAAILLFGRTRLAEQLEYARFAKFERKTFDWYVRSNPGSLRNGQVLCRHCGSGRISTKAVHERTYHREHHCVQCGKTLYYSSEQND